jgi:hypothetical protein
MGQIKNLRLMARFAGRNYLLSAARLMSWRYLEGARLLEFGSAA